MFAGDASPLDSVNRYMRAPLPAFRLVFFLFIIIIFCKEKKELALNGLSTAMFADDACP